MKNCHPQSLSCWRQELEISGESVNNACIERFHRGHGLFLLLAVATGVLYVKSSKLGKPTSEILK